MDTLLLEDVCDAVEGRWLTPPPEDELQAEEQTRIYAVCTNTREMEPGSLFVALKGERFDGHDFLTDADKAGAVAALVREGTSAVDSMHLIEVPDTRKALGLLARHVRRKTSAKIVAVAGSNGKTSTKHLIHAAMASRLRGSISPKSFNNDIGVPLTIFSADPRQAYLVLEMGTNHPGEIRTLTNMAEPDVAVLTNCSDEHLEFLGDVAGVRAENASIIEGLHPGGLLIVNGDDPELVAAVAGYTGRKVTFGFAQTNDLFAADVREDRSGVRFRLGGRVRDEREVFIPLLGRHSACNALAAIAAGRWFGLSDGDILNGLSTARGPEMRLQLMEMGGITLLNDAYNANPASMKAALETLRALPGKGRRIAVVGDMRELGESSPRLHEEVGKFAAGCDLDGLVCVGHEAELIAGVAQRLGMAQERITLFPDATAAARDVPGQLGDGDVVLLKGSRGIHLELVAAAIREKTR